MVSGKFMYFTERTARISSHNKDNLKKREQVAGHRHLVIGTHHNSRKRDLQAKRLNPRKTPRCPQVRQIRWADILTEGLTHP
jgi:hypothetical protein